MLSDNNAYDRGVRSCDEEIAARDERTYLRARHLMPPKKLAESPELQKQELQW